MCLSRKKKKTDEIVKFFLNDLLLTSFFLLNGTDYKCARK